MFYTGFPGSQILKSQVGFELGRQAKTHLRESPGSVGVRDGGATAAIVGAHRFNELKNSVATVYVIGAGASRHAQYPSATPWARA